MFGKSKMINYIWRKNENANYIHLLGFRFMFYSNDHEPIHVHIIKDGHEAKYNVEPIEQVYNHGFKRHDILMIESVIEENKEVIVSRWIDYFKEEKNG